MAPNPDSDDEDVRKMTKAERTGLKKEAIEARKVFYEDYLIENASYNMPKVHLMGHFPPVIVQFGVLKYLSTSIVELNHTTLNDAYDRTNKVDPNT